MGRPLIPLVERLELNSIPEPNTGCWLWTGCISESGYGSMGDTGRAHRVSYQVHVGPIPSGKVLDHLCRVRCCINPDHLEPVTQLENVRRGRKVDLSEKCLRGHEFSPENTRLYVRKDGRIKRQCAQCIQIRSVAYRERTA